MTPTQAIFLGLVAILALLMVCPSRAGAWRAIGRLVLRGAALIDLECQARADAQDAGQAAYRARKAAQ